MKLLFKTLKGEQFRLDVNETSPVTDVKSIVSQHLNNADAASGYRLIYAGKVLKDTDTLDKAGVTESGFLVVMPPTKSAQRPKPAAFDKAAGIASPVNENSPSVAAAAAALPPNNGAAAYSSPPSSDEASNLQSSEVPAAAASDAEPTPVTSGMNEPVSASAPPAASSNALLMGAEYDATVRQICDMGFPEEQVKRSLRAAFNNPDRAVEYLFSGIPDMPETSTQPAGAIRASGGGTGAQIQASRNMGSDSSAERTLGPGTQQTAAPGTPFNMFGGPTRTGAPARGRGAGNPVDDANDARQASQTNNSGVSLDFLRQLPQFDVMRRMIQANPALLAQLLQQLDQVNPALLSIINANQAEFVRLINEPIPPGEEGGDEIMEQLTAAMAGAGAEGSRSTPPPGQIYVTEEENQQLVRLTELGQTMGLERIHVVEAWLACDRNEVLAANYLLENMEELKTAQEEDAAAEAENDGNARTQDDQDPGSSPP